MNARQSVLCAVLVLCYTVSYHCIRASARDDLTIGRVFIASSTCGRQSPETHCYTLNQDGTIQRGECFICDSSDPLTSRGADRLNDNNDQETWWQSARGEEDVTIDLNFETFFSVSHVQVMFRSPLPSLAVLQVSREFGRNYSNLQTYSDNCQQDSDDSDSCVDVSSCSAEGVLVYDGERIEVTNLRLRLLRFNRFHGNYVVKDPIVVDHYAITEFSVGGECGGCEGEESVPCDLVEDTNGNLQSILADQMCTCFNCTSRPTPPPCDKPGVTGASCDSCMTGYFGLSESGCLPCNCSEDGSLAGSCDQETGQCECAPGVMGRNCNECPKGSIGPSRYLEQRCLECFCNGFTRSCESSEGWYQARVRSEFDEEEGGHGFKTNGIFEGGTDGFLDVIPSTSSDRLILSFPSGYLGDKRTAYSQTLSINYSLPNLNATGDSNSSPPLVQLEVVSANGHLNQFTVIIPLATPTRDPQIAEVTFVPGEPLLNLYYTRRPNKATKRRIREALADIRMMRMVVETPQGPGDRSSRTLRIHSISLDFATNNQSSEGPALQPLQEVSYVEECSCPSSRDGPWCQNCAEGFRNDRYVNQFSYCVPCFCNFNSETCDPETGECFECRGNTFGPQCGLCMERYRRQPNVFTGPCDQCQDGYWNPGNGTCIPCNCHPNGSLSLSCDSTTGSCDCREGVAGVRCDTCAPDTSGVFPLCQQCDECTDQWQQLITPFEAQVETTIEIIDNLNITNTSVSLPELDGLFDLVRDIESVLNTSMVEVLLSDVESAHTSLCDLINRTEVLIERANVVQNELESTENIVVSIESDLNSLTLLLSSLQQELVNLTLIFESEDFSSLNTSFYLELARRALARSNTADQLLTINVTSLVQEVQSILETYGVTFVSSGVESTQDEIAQRLAEISANVSAFIQFITDANSRLCGADNVSLCGECGGVACPTCGAGPSCDSLVASAAEAVNTSSEARERMLQLLSGLQIQINGLTDLLRDSETVRNESSQVEEMAEESRRRGEELVEDLRQLIQQVEVELNRNRTDPDDIGRIENVTLSLKLDLLPEEVFDLLVQINSTIDSFFSQANVSEDELRQRAEEALRTALRANTIATEVVANSTLLQQQLTQLAEERTQLQSTANDTQLLVDGAEQTLDEAEPLLTNSELLLNASKSALSELTTRLEELQLQIQVNKMELERARNLTAIADRLANQTEQDSLEVEEEFETLESEAQRKLAQSESDLEAAIAIRNRTAALQIRTQKQLLLVENLDRIRESLIQEQQMIRDDVGRVAIDLEELDSNIRIHIARNTQCLDAGTLQKRRRRRRGLK